MRVVIIWPEVDIGDYDSERKEARKKYITKEFGEDANISEYHSGAYTSPSMSILLSVLNDIAMADVVYFPYGNLVDKFEFSSIIHRMCKYTYTNHYIEFYKNGLLITNAYKYYRDTKDNDKEES